MLLGTIFKLDEDDDHAFTLCISFIFLGGVVWEFLLDSIKKEKMKKMKNGKMGKGKQKNKIHDIEKHVEEKDLTTQSCVGVTVLQTLYCMLHRHSTWGRIRVIEGESEWKRRKRKRRRRRKKKAEKNDLSRHLNIT